MSTLTGCQLLYDTVVEERRKAYNYVKYICEQYESDMNNGNVINALNELHVADKNVHIAYRNLSNAKIQQYINNENSI